MLKYLNVSFAEIPITKTFKIGNTEYDFLFEYNKRFGFLTVAIKKDDSVLYSSKIVYGNSIIKYTDLGFPSEIVPLTEDEFDNSIYSDILVNKDTFGKSVFLFFDDEV